MSDLQSVDKAVTNGVTGKTRGRRGKKQWKDLTVDPPHLQKDSQSMIPSTVSVIHP